MALSASVVRLVAQPVCFLLISKICQSKAQYYPLCPDFQLGKLGELNFRNFFPECEFTLILRILRSLHLRMLSDLPVGEVKNTL